MGVLRSAAWVITIPVLALLLRNGIVSPHDPELILEPFLRDTSPKTGSLTVDNAYYFRRNVRLPLGPSEAAVSGDAYFYMPKGLTQPPPLVVMGGGLGQQRDMGLDRFADRFAQRGLAVLAIDYRTFGGSDGEPRHLVDPTAHVADLVSAVRWVQQTGVDGSVDNSRIGLWGTSLGGGHVLVAASQLGNALSAVVSLVPHLSGTTAALNNVRTRGVLGALRLVAAGAVDKLRSLSGLPPAYIPLAGLPGSLSVMQLTPEELINYRSKHPKDPLGGWQMRITARTMLMMGRYSPINYLGDVKAPVHMTTAALDTLCPPHLAQKAAAANPLIQHVSINSSHFEIYMIPEVREQQADFLEQHLRPERPTI